MIYIIFCASSISVFIYYFISCEFFHTSVSWCIFTGVWVTESLLSFPGLFWIFSLISKILVACFNSSFVYNSSSLLSKPLETVPREPKIIGIIVTLIFNSFFSPLARAKYLFIFSLSFIFTLWSAETVKFTRQQIFFFYVNNRLELGDSFIPQKSSVFYATGIKNNSSYFIYSGTAMYFANVFFLFDFYPTQCSPHYWHGDSFKVPHFSISISSFKYFLFLPYSFLCDYLLTLTSIRKYTVILWSSIFIYGYI